MYKRYSETYDEMLKYAKKRGYNSITEAIKDVGGYQPHKTFKEMYLQTLK